MEIKGFESPKSNTKKELLEYLEWYLSKSRVRTLKGLMKELIQIYGYEFDMVYHGD